MEVDVLIFGGGIAGLWLLDELRRRGYHALLVEREALGAGQTIASQGIIHGGLKYTLSGLMNPSAQSVSEMPQRWRDCLAGRIQPHLVGARILSPCCYLWRTESWRSRLGMLGARVGLHTAVERVVPAARPQALAACLGDVYRVEEPVIDVASVLQDLADRHRDEGFFLAADDTETSWQFVGQGRVESVELRNEQSRIGITLRPRTVIFTAGSGNAALRAAIGLGGDVMQRRPLHMVMVRGVLPPLFGHCIDGNKTRVTITSAFDESGRTVWYVGGHVAEDGVHMEPTELIAHARQELQAVLGKVNLRDTEWATHRVDRAEGRQPSGLRPDGPVVRREGSTITAWPTKLALAPRLVEIIADSLEPPRATRSDGTSHLLGLWPRPEVAKPPWELCPSWRS